MENGVMMQYFHWYTPEGNLWNEVKEQAPFLASLGINALWLPPACKAAAGLASAGYDPYDLYDLGEFNQKGGVRTKYGTKKEYIDAIHALHKNDMQAIVDVVINHKAGADETERVLAIKVKEDDRTVAISEPHEVEVFTKFTFPGRKHKYSNFEWDKHCFSGVDYDKLTGDTGIFKFINDYGNDWEEMIDDEKGNYDYLMFCDLEFRNPAVRNELKVWAKWYYDSTKFDGVRLDAVKHINPKFFKEWLTDLREKTGKEIFAVGEYWAPGNLAMLMKYLEATDHTMSLFDSALQHSFHKASMEGADFDMQTILDGSLMLAVPLKAVTLVDNHDTQPLQALEAPVEAWFKPMAYALILLRIEGYPCVFYPDLFGCSYKDTGNDGNEHEIFLAKVPELETLLAVRHNNACGDQHIYFDDVHCIGFTRSGIDKHQGCAVIMSNGEASQKQMFIGLHYAGKIFKDCLYTSTTAVIIDDDGSGNFACAAKGISVYVLDTDGNKN